MGFPTASNSDLVELIGDVDAPTRQPDSAESVESVLAATERAPDDASRR